MRIVQAQINCTVGDFQGNSLVIQEYLQKAKTASADIIVFPELAVCGYPPEDLLLKKSFIADNLEEIRKIAKSVEDLTAVVGFVDQQGAYIYNSAAVIYQKKIRGVYRKTLLPNYGVFDEKRYFQPGSKPIVFNCAGLVFAVNICEDIWHTAGPTKYQAKAKAKLILNINASPYHAGKTKEREELIKKQAKANRVFIAYTNLVGGQDELVFDGQSMLVDDRGRLIAHAHALKEDLLISDIELALGRPGKDAISVGNKFFLVEKKKISARKEKPLELIEEIYQVLLLGLRDYVSKNGFAKVVIGLSGGVDSALVAALAVDALGKDNVIGVFMPSRFSSEQSASDARQLADNLGIKFLIIPIEEIFQVYLNTFQPHFAGLAPDITEENLQARIRGNILMALSNKFKWLVLTTGNKSEMSTGYATLYGDMAGGFALIKDVTKIMVYRLCKYRNASEVIIPESVLTKEPTAELRDNQKDIDTLPPYETLDAILKAYIEEDKDSAKIISQGFDRSIVSKVLEMVDKSEYKRRQSPPGVKITHKAFGKDRRMPITNKYRCDKEGRC